MTLSKFFDDNTNYIKTHDTCWKCKHFEPYVNDDLSNGSCLCDEQDVWGQSYDSTDSCEYYKEK